MVGGEVCLDNEHTFQLLLTNRQSFVSLDDVNLSLSLGCSYVSATATTPTAVAVSPSVTLHLKDYPTILPQARSKIELTDVLTGDVFSTLVRSLIVQLAEKADACFASLGNECWLELTATRASERRSAHDHDLIHLTLQPPGISALVTHVAAPILAEGGTTSQAVNISEFTSTSSSRSYKVTQRVDDATGDIEVVWGVTAGRAVVGAACGRLLHYSPAGVEMNSGSDIDASGHGRSEEVDTNILTSPVDLCLYRAPTDNDRGGDAMSYHQQWLAAGYHCLVRKEGSVRVQVEESGNVDAITVLASWTLIPSEEVAMENTGIDCSIRYTFLSTGQIDFCFSTTVPSHLPPVPRVGVRTALNRQLDQVEWLGLGPHEAYDDRKAMVYLDHFTSTVEDLHTEYVFPQECGRRMDPRWVTFRNSSGMGFEVSPCRELPATESCCNAEVSPYQCSGLLSVGGEGTDSNQVWGWSASRYSAEQLAETDHNHELQPDGNGQVHVHLDRLMMGIAGYDSWSPNVPTEFLIPVGKTITGQMTWTPLLPASDQPRG
jgi:hypothetical protein